MFEKPDEHGHYGYLLYLREHRALPPFIPLKARSATLFKQADQPFTRFELAWELHQPPLYYVVTALLTSWLPDEPDPDQFFDRNPFIATAAPGERNDNRNYFLHPPDMTPLVLAARLISLLFGLGTMVAAYFLAAQLFPASSKVPIAVAAITGFQPSFLFIATAVNNDAATVFFGTLVITLLLYRQQRGDSPFFVVSLGVCLGLAGLTKVSGLVFFPLVGLALLLIHRGLRPALFRDGIVVLIIALLVGGWWYARNAWLYGDPLLMGAHPTPGADTISWNRLRHDLLSIEFTFWANQSITFLSPIALDQALVWWGRIGLGLLAIGLIVNYRSIRASLPTVIALLSWPAAFLFLLVMYWNPRTLLPWGRFLLPAIAPTVLLLLMGWHTVFLPRRRWLAVFATTLSAGAVMTISILIPFMSLYPSFHPSREWQAKQVEHPVGITYVNPETKTRVARLIGYNLPRPYASPGQYYPIELCWEALNRTDVPYAVFLHLLDVSRDPPAIWGTRETYPGLGNRPTDRWDFSTFCDTVLVQVSPQVTTPMGAGMEVGFVDPNHQDRLQPVDAEGDPLDLAVVGRVPVLSSNDLPTALHPARYVLGDAIGLNDVQISGALESSATLTLTWQSRRPVPFDATMFAHLKAADGSILAQIDRQPMEGRLPTSLWLPGQIITDVVSLPFISSPERMPLTLNIGMYTWPSLQRLAVKDAGGRPQRDDVIVVDVPQR